MSAISTRSGTAWRLEKQENNPKRILRHSTDLSRISIGAAPAEIYDDIEEALKKIPLTATPERAKNKFNSWLEKKIKENKAVDQPETQKRKRSSRFKEIP